MTLEDLLSINNITVSDYGEKEIEDIVSAALAEHNRKMDAFIDANLWPTTERHIVHEIPNAELSEEETPTDGAEGVEEYTEDSAEEEVISTADFIAGVSLPGKIVHDPRKRPLYTPTDTHIPLRLYGISTQWTRTFFQNATPAEIASFVLKVFESDISSINRTIMRTLLNNRTVTFRDRLVDHAQFDVHPLYNGEGNNPTNVHEEVSHNHYTGIPNVFWGSKHPVDRARADEALSAAVQTVREHYPNLQVNIYSDTTSSNFEIVINKNHKSGLKLLANFRPVEDGMSVADERDLEARNIPHMVGSYQGIPVWVRSWAPRNYVLVRNTAVKGIAYRHRESLTSGQLTIQFEADAYPLRGAVFAREYGMAPLDRGMAAVLYLNPQNRYGYHYENPWISISNPPSTVLNFNEFVHMNDLREVQELAMEVLDVEKVLD